MPADSIPKGAKEEAKKNNNTTGRYY